MDFVNGDVFKWVCEKLKLKDPKLNLDRIHLKKYKEGNYIKNQLVFHPLKSFNSLT